MKILPPTPEIPPDDPYKNDLLNRKDFGASLYSLFKNVEESVVLCVDAPWGQGKTTFAKMWMADLRSRGVSGIYFDAYEHDFSDDPFIAFCARIIDMANDLSQKTPSIQSSAEDFKEKAVKVGGKLLRTGLRVGLKALSFGGANDEDLDDLVSIKDDLTGKQPSDAAIVGQALDSYVSSRKALEEFRQRLSALGESVRKAQDGFPLLIVIDELDRCRPDFALALIERIKHLFTVPNVCFALLLNMEQLESYVEVVYGTGVDARKYLHKFLSLYTQLPRDRENGKTNEYFKYVGRMMEHYGVLNSGEDARFLASLFRHYSLSLREMERCFCMLSVCYSQVTEGAFKDDLVLPFLAVMRLKMPDVFEDLMLSRLTFGTLTERAMLEEATEEDEQRFLSFPTQLFRTYLGFYLVSDEEYRAAAPESDLRYVAQGILGVLFRHRKEIMPYLCSLLIKFSIAEQ